MSGHASRHGSENQDWDAMSPKQVLAALVHDIYTPVSLISSQLNRITGDSDPLTEEEYEAIFEQMQQAISRLSKTVVRLRKYVQEQDGTTVEG